MVGLSEITGGRMCMNISDVLTLVLVIFTALNYIDNHQKRK